MSDVAPAERAPRLVQLGPGGRLFGALDLPFDDRPPVDSALVLPPFGHEAVSSHRALRQLAARLARAGLATLRIDWSGTGDSAGESGELPFETWLGDARAAADWLAARFHSPLVVGLRLGASLAVHAGLGRDRPIALWQPVVDGRAYLAHLERLQAAHAAEWGWSRDANAAFETLGFELSTDAVRAVEALSAASFEVPTLDRRSLHLVNLDDEEQRALSATVGYRLERVRVDDPSDWLFEPFRTSFPEASLARLSSWVAAVRGGRA